MGLFSAKVRDYLAQLDALGAQLTALGVQVRGRFVQRRGVSDGGVRLLTSPLSRRFLIGPGKLEEVAAACLADEVDAVVFINDLTAYQRRWLSTRLGCPVLTKDEVDQSASGLTMPTQQRHQPGRSSMPNRRR